MRIERNQESPSSDDHNEGKLKKLPVLRSVACQTSLAPNPPRHLEHFHEHWMT
jgi:hypothetical protein